MGIRSRTKFGHLNKKIQKTCMDPKHRKKNVIKNRMTCIVIYTTARIIHLLPHFPYTWAKTTAGSDQHGFLRGIICTEPGRWARPAPPRWLWHLFNTGPSVFTLPDKGPVCRLGPPRPLGYTDSAANTFLDGISPMSNGCQKLLILQALFSSPRGQHSSLSDSIQPVIAYNKLQIADWWPQLI